MWKLVLPFMINELSPKHFLSTIVLVSNWFNMVNEAVIYWKMSTNMMRFTLPHKNGLILKYFVYFDDKNTRKLDPK